MTWSYNFQLGIVTSSHDLCAVWIWTNFYPYYWIAYEIAYILSKFKFNKILPPQIFFKYHHKTHHTPLQDYFPVKRCHFRYGNTSSCIFFCFFGVFLLVMDSLAAIDLGNKGSPLIWFHCVWVKVGSWLRVKTNQCLDLLAKESQTRIYLFVWCIPLPSDYHYAAWDWFTVIATC